MNTANQLCCLRELVLAKQAYDRAFSEFLVSLNRDPRPEKNLADCVYTKLLGTTSRLAQDDARDITIDQLIDVLEIIGTRK